MKKKPGLPGRIEENRRFRYSGLIDKEKEFLK